MAKRERSQATGGDAGDAAKGDALAAALLVIERQYGRGAVMRLGGSYAGDADPAISTGSLGLDLACGVGGFPRGRIVEVYGPESSGKTTLALHAVANAQALGGTAAIVDAEHALDPAYARRLGVDLENLLVSQPDSGEQALDIVELLVRSNSVDLIVVDSVAALTPRAELEGAMGDSHMGLQARLMSQALRKLTGAIRKSRAVVIFINQIRMQIGVMFGNPEITPGGRALKFHASLRIDIRRIQTLKKGEEPIGIKVRAKVVKNKVAPPFREAQFDILFARGINREGELIDLGSAAGLVQKSGSWFSWNGSRLGQGRDQAAAFVKEHPDVADELEQALRAGPAEAVADGAGAPEESDPENDDG